jgi:hypothetical protein
MYGKELKNYAVKRGLKQMFTPRKSNGGSHNLWNLRQFSSFH